MDEQRTGIIVVGAGNAGMSAAHAARERGCDVVVLEKADPEWSGGNSAFTAGAIRLAHGGVDDLREILEGVDAARGATDLDPYTEDDFLADMRRVTLGRGDAEMAGILVRDSGAAVRWLHERGLRFRLMYERQAYEVDGRHRFWGGLAVGTVDGGEGLMAQHRAAAERTGIDMRHGIAVTTSCATTRARCAAWSCGTRTARGGDRGRRGRPRGGRLRGQPADARRPPRPELGRREGPRHAAQHGRGAGAALAHGAQAYGHWSGCHAIQWDADAPPDRRPRDHEPLLAPVLSGRDRRERRRRALPRRGRGLPQLHLREVRRRGPAPARGHRRAGLRRQDGRPCCARSTTRRRAPRA